MSIFYERTRLARLPNDAVLTEPIRRRAEIGLAHWHASLDLIPDDMSYKQTIQGYMALLREHEEVGRGLFLYGAVGTGKTSVGSIILRNALAKGARVLSIRAFDMIRKLNNFKGSHLLNGAPLEVALANVNYLLLDDLEDETDKRRARIFESVVRARYDDNLPTIITTNLPKEEFFKSKWLKSLMRRDLVGVDVDGVDWRKDPPDVAVA